MPNKLILLLLALGTFAVGTDTFVISGVLPDIARSLHVSQPVTGQLITAFALTYAISAPVLAAFTSAFSRRKLLASALALFVVSNVIGMLTPTYWLMVVARVIAGLAAGLCIPASIVIASSIAPERVRGRSIAIVAGGMTVATALGVPIGTLIGAIGNWRETLALVALIASVALVGILLWLPEVPQPPAVSLRRRLQVGFQPVLLQAFGANILACAGIFAMFTFIAPLTHAITGFGGSGVSATLLVWGVAAIGGSAVGGWLSDRYNGNVSFAISVTVLLASLLALGLLDSVGRSAAGLTTTLFMVVIVIASVACWSLPPAQNHRVSELATDAPAVALSLNSSSSYLGFAIGGAVGGAVVGGISLGALSWVGAGIEAVALGLVVLGVSSIRSRSSAQATELTPQPGAVSQR